MTTKNRNRTNIEIFFINSIEFEYFRSRTFLKDDDNYYYRDGEFDYYINENYHVLDRNHDSPVKLISIHDLEVTVVMHLYNV